LSSVRRDIPDLRLGMDITVPPRCLTFPLWREIEWTIANCSGGLAVSPTALPSINPDCQRIFAHPAISATTHRAKAVRVLAALLDGLALAIALFKEPEIVQDVLVVGILAASGGKRCMRALVVAAQHV